MMTRDDDDRDNIQGMRKATVHMHSVPKSDHQFLISHPQHVVPAIAEFITKAESKN